MDDQYRKRSRGNENVAERVFVPGTKQRTKCFLPMPCRQSIIHELTIAPPQYLRLNLRKLIYPLAELIINTFLALPVCIVKLS